MILVDSSVWIDYFNGKITPKTDWLYSALGNQPIVVGDIILTEVLRGFKSEKDFKTAKSLLLNFPVVAMLGKEMAIKSAMNYRFLKKKGVIIRKTIDVIIGSFCIYNNFLLLYDDRDFNPLVKHLNLILLSEKFSQKTKSCMNGWRNAIPLFAGNSCSS